MAVAMYTTIIDKPEDLIDFIQNFDGDFSGENGPDYMSEEAVEGGFESDTEYEISEARKYHKDLVNIASSVLGSLVGTYDSGDYVGADYSVISISGGLQAVVSFAYGSED